MTTHRCLFGLANLIHYRRAPRRRKLQRRFVSAPAERICRTARDRRRGAMGSDTLRDAAGANGGCGAAASSRQKQ